MNETNTVVSHYYPLLPHTLPHQQDFHPGMMYPQQIPPTVSTDFYSMQPHFYSPAARVPYPGQPLYPPGHHQHQMNGYHLGQFEAGNVSSLHQPNAPFPPAPTSTLISPHLQSSAQSISIPALSKVEFDKKQRHLQQQDRPTSHRRSRTPSSSSYPSSGSRSSSFSHGDSRRRRSSRSPMTNQSVSLTYTS